ncbi:MAG: hypothetical protein U1E65_28300 [Myxococcota bacterium]
MTDELPSLPKDVLALLEAERAAPPVESAIASKIFGRLELSLGLPAPPIDHPRPPDPPPNPPAAPPPSGAVAALTKAVGVKGALVVALATGAAMGGSVVGALKSQAPERVVVVHDLAPAPAPALTETPTVAPPEPRPAPRPRPVAPPPVDERQRMLLERAHVALSRGEVGQALKALDEHQRAYPVSAIEEERETLWILALHQAGRGDEARARFLRFQKRFPKSLSIASLRTALAQ